MKVRISRESDVPIHEQLAAQLVLQIGSGALEPGELLPSVRALARRLNIHRNTVSRAYQDPVLSLMVVKRPGSRLAVRGAPRKSELGDGADLDELINSALREAQRCGYTLQQLHRRIAERAAAAPPERILVVSDDAGMRVLFSAEIRERFKLPVDACSAAELIGNPTAAAGSLVVSPPGHLAAVEPLLPPERPAIPITYSPPDDAVAAVRLLEKPSLIALVSISEYFLEMAEKILASEIETRHSITQHLLRDRLPKSFGAADLVLCDLVADRVARRQFRNARVLTHRMIAAECLDRIEASLRR